MNTQSFKNFTVGDHVVFERSYSLADFAAFSKLSGDGNPLHHETGYAERSSFGRLIVPLHITLAPLSMIAGMVFPGEPSLYLGHEVHAARPVHYDETIRYSARIETINTARSVLGLRVLALRGAEVVLDARMRVQALKDEWETPPTLVVRKASEPGLAVVTGAAGEIGGAIACALAAKGWRLLLQDRGKKESRQLVEERLARLGAKAEFIAADLATAEGRADLAGAVSAREDIGLLIHAASPPVNATTEDLVAVNFTAFKSLIDAALPAMLLRQKAAVVLISSIATEHSLPGWEAYAGAKSMAASLSNGVEQKYSPYGVRGLAILPGLVATKFSEAYRDEETSALLPQEVGEAVLRQIDDDAPGNAMILEVGRQQRGRIGFHLPGAVRSAATTAAESPEHETTPEAAPSAVAATLRKVLRLAPGTDVSQAELGITPGWDSLKHLELLLEIEAA
ncbi:MAG TPA: SDR family NAD(P)-dependent oxidoreductase, partial [Chthoniobacterales bacterium]|nr:SDR family NAD(P)-dependent oxidoreductase [Chthoniobacterales bacterium]